ncbi:MAG TPA: alkaline phosphatase family protein [Bacteroidales bacterium]|nr:alkaline phosphatase family protein [Bacteroidales bacterium]
MHKINIFLLSCISGFLLFSAPVRSQNFKIPSEKPKLIVGIVVSQMRYDYIQRFWDKLDDNGFKLLADRGTYCRNTRFNYLFSQEGVGHASISTGTTPADHGIVGREWYLYLQDKIEGSTEDQQYKAVGGDVDNGHYSPKNLMCTTFGDELRLSNNFTSKVFSISPDPAPGIFSAGHTANGSYWFDPRTGNWITSTYYTDTLPKWVNDFNAKKFPDIYLKENWETLLSIDKYTESLPDKNKYETGLKGQTTFPYILADLSEVKKNRLDYSLLNKTPFGFTYTSDFAVNLIANEKLGEDDVPDVLMVCFTALENIGDLFGPNSVELEDAFLRLDKELAHFLSFLDEQVGKQNTLVFLTSDHGVAQVPSYLSDSKIPAGYFNSNGAISLLMSALNNTYGKGEWIRAYHAQQIYLNHTLIEDSKLSLTQMQDYIAQFMLQFSGVANTVTSRTMQTANFTDGVFRKIQNSYNQKRSGDVIINLKAGWVEKGEASTGGTSSYSYDSRIPLIWYGWKLGRGNITREVDIIDIAPTISTFLNITYPNSCTGTPIYELMQ